VQALVPRGGLVGLELCLVDGRADLDGTGRGGRATRRPARAEDIAVVRHGADGRVVGYEAVCAREVSHNGDPVQGALDAAADRGGGPDEGHGPDGVGRKRRDRPGLETVEVSVLPGPLHVLRRAIEMRLNPARERGDLKRQLAGDRRLHRTPTLSGAASDHPFVAHGFA